MSGFQDSHSFEQAVAALAAKAGSALKHRNGHASPIIETVSVSLDRVDPLVWLHVQASAPRVYWAGRDYGFEAAGIGIADGHSVPVAKDLSALRKQLDPPLSSCAPSVKYFGGIRFDLRLPHEPHWQGFGAWNFVLPRIELRRTRQGTQLRCNLVLPRDYSYADPIIEEIKGLAYSCKAVMDERPSPLSHAYRPTQEGWRSIVDRMLETIEQSPLEKIVLARETRVSCSSTPDPVALLSLLKAGTPRCFHFLFQPTRQSAFIGASPERLFRRRHEHVEAEAVAGSRPKGVSDADDARLVEELLSSDKERREHEYVRISLKEELRPLVESLQMDADCSVMRLASARHLVSRVRATLRRSVTSLDVLDAIHPSPAVGGLPSSLALQKLLDQEPFDRGWYAGPVGWIGPKAAEFAVGIRSGLIGDRQVRLYSGAGIVLGSTWQSEWDELEDKIVDFSRVLGLPTRAATASRFKAD